MKKHLLALMIAVLLAMISLTSCGGRSLTADEGKPADGFLWENNYSEITITGYQGASNDIVIPEKINGKPVTKIEREAFKRFSALKSVKIPGTVKEMIYAFERCTGLTKVTIGEGVENISGAFYQCESLTELSLPESVKYIDCFRHCSALEKIKLPESCKPKLESSENFCKLFEGCTSIKTITASKEAEECLLITYENTKYANIDSSNEFVTINGTKYPVYKKDIVGEYSEYDYD